MTAIPPDLPRHPRASTVRVTGPSGQLPLTVMEYDGTRPFVLLHGGGGPATMAGFAALLADRAHARVLLPTHPGFMGTPRPETLASTRDLARCYVGLFDELDLTDVIVVGNSFGGWLAAEIALLGSPRVGEVVVVDGVGIQVNGHPVTNVRGLAPQELQKLSFHDPSRAPRPPGGAGNGPSPDLAALLAYTGPDMADPTLAGRLGTLAVRAHVIWGESDGIVDTTFGKAFADAMPNASFTVLPGTGHLPQVETPEDLLAALLDLVGVSPRARLAG